jgi:CheY-like chemotaxis protein
MLLQKDRIHRVDVLIAEDDTTTRQSLRRLLEAAGYNCAEAGTGREAIELAQQHPPQCVLLDLRMPELDGFSVARQLRADPRTQGAYIHCLTGWTDEAVREQAAQAGCNLFLTKPVDAAALLHVVHHDLRDPAERVRGLTKTEAEELLDWLEAHGAAGALDYEEGQGFAVRCPGFRVEKDASGRLQLSRRAGPTGP